MAGFENVFVMLSVFFCMGVACIAVCYLGIRILFSLLRWIVGVVNAVWSAIFSVYGAIAAVTFIVFFVL